MPRLNNQARKAPAWTVRDNNREARIQAACVEYARLVAPQILVFHVPNGGPGRSLSRLKWMGALSGVADLVLIDEHTLSYLVEVKDVDGALSDDQKVFRDDCARRKIPYAVVRNVNEMADAMKKFGIKTRDANKR